MRDSKKRLDGGNAVNERPWWGFETMGCVGRWFPAMIRLHKEMVYRFTTQGPLGSTVGSPLGEREYHEMIGGTLVGDRINAQINAPGSDWMRRSGDGFSRPDVRVQLTTDDHATVWLHYRGLVERTEAFMTAASGNSPTEWSDQYMRFFISFDTGSNKYAWLNQHLFIARGRLRGPSELEYEIYRVE